MRVQIWLNQLLCQSLSWCTLLIAVYSGSMQHLYTSKKCSPATVGNKVRCDADYDVLIAAGGDGTINQVVNELVEQDAPKETCLAVLPLGTANDFATSLTIHDDNLVQAMQTAVKGISLLSGSRGSCLTD